MDASSAFDLIERAIDTGHAAHGYLLCGDLGAADALVRRILEKLFPGEPEKIAAGQHPDVVRLEPQGASRTIKVERGKSDTGPGMRDGLLAPMSVTSFSGGWKVGVIVSADRLQPAAANAFLKTLEEPPPKTLFLLTSDSPDSLLPTIVSRTQRIDLPRTSGTLDDDARKAIAAALAGLGRSVLDKSLAAHRLAEIYQAKLEDDETGDVSSLRKSFFREVMANVREWMAGGNVPRHLAFANVESVEKAYERISRSLPVDAVLAEMTCSLTAPQEAK